MLSVIVPAYNEEQTAVWTAEKLGKILSEAEIPYELIFVDDGSKDHTWQAIGLGLAFFAQFRQGGGDLRWPGGGGRRLLRGDRL